MDAQRITGRVEVHNCRFRSNAREKPLDEVGNIIRKVWLVIFRISLFGPIILTAKGHPTELSLQELEERQRLVDVRIKRGKGGETNRGKFEEGMVILITGGFRR